MSEKVGPNAGASPDRRAALRALYEQRRADFHEAVRSLPDERWSARSSETGWTNGQLLVHIADVLSRVPAQIATLRHGEDFRRLPRWAMALLHPVQYLLVRRRARRLTRAEVLELYDAAHDQLLRALDEIREEQWERRGRVFGLGTFTLIDWLEAMAAHVREHLDQVSWR